MKKTHTNTLKTKFFLSMSLMVTIIVIILLGCILPIFYNQFLKQRTESSLNQLSYIKNQLNYYLFSMDNYSKMIITNEDVQKDALKYRDTPDKFTAKDKKNMQTVTRKFIQSIPYIHSASIYAPDLALTGTTAVASYPSSLESVLPCDSPKFLIRTKYSNITLRTPIQTLSQIRPFYDISSGSLLGYIEISIPEKEIAAIYRSNSSSTSRFFIVDRAGRVVSTDGSYALESEFTPFTALKSKVPTRFQISGNAICFTTYLESLDWYIINMVDLAEFYRPIYMILFITAAISFLCMAISLLVSRKISDTITKPLYHLITHIQKVKQGHWIPMNEKPDDTDIGLLFSEFDSMIIAQKQLTDQLLDSQKLKNKISLELLQQQVNPHFLYNTLDNICSLAELDEKENLIRIVMNLSKFYRGSLSSGNFLITIRDELEITRSYIRIMQVRYYNKFEFSIDCPEYLYSFSCLKLLLQPIVENSIYHGIKELSHKGIISIRVQAVGETILFQIQDNGPGIPPELKEEIWNYPEGHFGIKNIHERIRLHYGLEYGLSMENAPEGGLITTIAIPRQGGGPA
ncbi:Histidine kinase-, DNA gyrase B-, and HSP90-like ATPase [Anaerocolumna jejuensis DSM 15929]|uniref:Histidine kinase-, DNA gyrase B-, and HSP90-like ATPase n=1 Tax=Anaerocolumna jejuensis DSM 15929 TaxID=1121322 RepID=A0A1M6NP78_9FIRM|nr:sensor histidine kinase [Anaerocolumna jejuensis]SHJ97468.1 Histidine kinase-, DNA gyrase B-, and HSP90-like ATPase [Anaerocolumna jejuensis DSM 15929]